METGMAKGAARITVNTLGWRVENGELRVEREREKETQNKRKQTDYAQHLLKVSNKRGQQIDGESEKRDSVSERVRKRGGERERQTQRERDDAGK